MLERAQSKEGNEPGKMGDRVQMTDRRGKLPTTPSEIKHVLDSLGIRWNKRYGQHFIIDDHIIDRHVSYAKISPDETVLEIGPGLGVLTERLLEKAGKVVAIERDRKLCEYLEANLDAGKLQLICGDALEVKLPEFDKAVSNLPYNISSEITFRILDHNFKSGILMYQREFAERMVAKCGSDDYSRLSVNIYYRAQCEIQEYVPRGVFFPQPEVDSALVSLVPRAKPPFKVSNEKLFFIMVEALFSHRRKKIGNSLELWLRGMERKRCDFLKGLPFVDDRVETLSPEEIGQLSDEVGKRI